MCFGSYSLVSPLQAAPGDGDFMSESQVVNSQISTGDDRVAPVARSIWPGPAAARALLGSGLNDIIGTPACAIRRYSSPYKTFLQSTTSLAAVATYTLFAETFRRS